MLGGSLRLFLHGIQRLSRHLQILLERQALTLEAICVFLKHLVSPEIHHGLRELHLQHADQGIRHRVLESVLSRMLTAVSEFFRQILPELLQSIELGDILGKLIVHHRSLGFLDLVDLNLEHDGLAGKLRAVVLGEGHVQILLITGLESDHALFKAGNKGVRSQLQSIVLPLAAFKGHSVVKALEINENSVALFGLALHVHQAGGTLNERLELIFHVLVGDVDFLFRRSESFILADLVLRLYGNQGFKCKAVLADLQDFHLRIGHGVQALLLHSLGISVRIELVDGVLIEHAGAIHTLDDLAGSVTLPEPGNGDILPVLPVDLIHRGLKLLGADLDDQLDGAILLFFFTLDVHLLTSS